MESKTLVSPITNSDLGKMFAAVSLPDNPPWNLRNPKSSVREAGIIAHHYSSQKHKQILIHGATQTQRRQDGLEFILHPDNNPGHTANVTVEAGLIL